MSKVHQKSRLFASSKQSLPYDKHSAGKIVINDQVKISLNRKKATQQESQKECMKELFIS